MELTMLPDRLSTKIQTDDTGCWRWTAGKDRDGYGRVYWNGHPSRVAHRVVFELLESPIPDGLQIDHLCRVRDCVNPEHLEPVTQAENIKRGETGKYQTERTHCPQGHEYNEGNTYRYPSGRRKCRACDKEISRRLRNN